MRDTGIEKGVIEGPPKSDAGVRVVAIPSHVIPAIRRHLDTHVGDRPDSLVFPNTSGEYLGQTTFRRPWMKAVKAAGRPGLRFHDLPHTGATLAGQSGASIAELQFRLGHSTVPAAMRYQHATQERDRALADKMSELAQS